MAPSRRLSSVTSLTRTDKVYSIFCRFDVNNDGGLSREEMGALVTAVNPNVKFSSEQISAILDEVFKTYSDFIENPLPGLSFDGLLRTYDDGAGDVDRDYSALFSSSDQVSLTSHLETPSCSTSSSMIGLADKWLMTQKIPNLRVAPAWAKSPNHGVDYDATWKLVEDMEIVIRRKIKTSTYGNHKKNKFSNSSDGFSDNGWSTDYSVEFDDKKFFWDENCKDFRKLLKEVRDIRAAIDRNLSREEAFDRHMAIGRTLCDYKILKEALQSFQRAADLRPVDARPHFRIGNCLCSLGKLDEAKVSFMLGLELAETNSGKWLALLPQIHVNLGIVLEGEGMLLSACEHYREAAVLCPTHYRALKHLGSALFGVGEYKAAEKALEEAVFLSPEFPDAHCDLGVVLHAMEEDEKAILEFQRAIDLNPSHLDALYNLGCLFQDLGRYQRAAEMYGRVLGIQPNHWRAQVNRAISLFGGGEATEARKALRGALKSTERVELYDTMAHMKQLKKKNHGGRFAKKKENLADASDVIVVEASKFKMANEKTTRREFLASALHVRDFQRTTRLHQCDVFLLNKEIGGPEEWEPNSDSKSEEPEKSITKATLEVVLRKLLHFLKPETFQGAVKAVDQQILSVLDATSSGRVDLGMFYAVIAPICAGEPLNRKRAAFDALSWRSRKQGQGFILKVDALIYMRYLRLIYLTSQGYGDHLVAPVEGEAQIISFSEFLQIFDDNERGFGILRTLVRLETQGRIRHGGHACEACRYPIIGSIFKEMTSHFSLCMSCYSHGSVPSKFKQEQYTFKEYSSEAELVKDKLKLFR